ncbi:MAG: indole-3-glycerol-phosphate synthase [Defluviitaleaceae bacterium]|nr:indole-3-glycerol-phosphate synthase [Defluviitaleaceae bacterium]
MSGRFSDAIINENRRGYIAVIPDIKCVSPKEGDLLQGRDPVQVAKFLVECGAPMLSVVTEGKHFGGNSKLLRDIVKSTDVPVLRKDFVTNEDMLAETAELGATAVLLICAITDEENLYALYEKSIKLGLEPFVEVCTAAEMAMAKKMGAKLIGINNRNIATLETDSGDTSRTIDLAAAAPHDALLVSESGILSTKDAEKAVRAGANAVLVGTALWQAHDMGKMYQALRVERMG